MFKQSLFAALLLFSFVDIARAQTSYVTATGFADFKRFGSSSGIGYTIEGANTSLDSTGAGGGVRFGTFIHPKFNIELSIDDEAPTKRTVSNPYTIAQVYPPIPVPNTTVQTSFFTFTTAVGFRPKTTGRVRPAYFGGFALVHATYKSDYYSRIVPLATAIAVALPGFPAPVIPAPTTAAARAAITSTENTTGIMMGFETAFDLTTHLSVVPEIRVMAFSVRTDGVFLIKPGVGARWSF